MEMAVNLLRAVILHLDTRGHCGAVWRSRSDLRGQLGGSFGRSVVSSQVRWLQGRHRRQDGGGGGGRDAAATGAAAGGLGERLRRTLRVGMRGSVLPQREEGRQRGG